MRISYTELSGELRPQSLKNHTANVPLVASIVRSNISRGEAEGPSLDGLKLRFVARGTEDYRIAGRHYRLDAGQLMLAPQRLGSEVFVRAGIELQGTLGLCIFFPCVSEELLTLVTGPIVLSADCPLGESMENGLKRLSALTRPHDEPAAIAVRALSLLDRTLVELEAQASNLSRVKRETQFETLRRMHLARSYLHHVTGRAVPLEELASEVAVSPFHLLRCFRDCFGETPATYHRRLRLTLAHELAWREGLSYDFVSDLFGFSGGSSFNHAFRRTFGTSPFRKRAGRS